MPFSVTCEEEPFWIEGDDYKLAAFKHIPCNVENPPVVLMLHGFTGNKIEDRRLFVNIARELCARGLAVIRFDYRGHGESPGSFEDFTLSQAFEDADLAARYALAINDRIGVVGLSLGGAVAIHLATSSLKDFIRCVVLLSPAIDFREICVRLRAGISSETSDFAYLGPQRIRLKGLSNICSFNGLEYAVQMSAPTLIIHAKDDSVVPYTQSTKFFKALHIQDKELILLEEGGHVFSTYESRRSAIKQCTSWLIRHLTER
ncbi:MAG: alpha/beta fold hydrolase [Thermoprotei archaeon]|nr:alpha/beta fold hydrolase [Thermoprotei archaeon]